MKVIELINALRRHDDMLEVLLSCDEEGNRYYHLDNEYGISANEKCLILYPCAPADESKYLDDDE